MGEGAVSSGVITKGCTGKCHLDKDQSMTRSEEGTANAKAGGGGRVGEGLRGKVGELCGVNVKGSGGRGPNRALQAIVTPLASTLSEVQDLCGFGAGDVF